MATKKSNRAAGVEAAVTAEVAPDHSAPPPAGPTAVPVVTTAASPAPAEAAPEAPTAEPDKPAKAAKVKSKEKKKKDKKKKNKEAVMIRFEKDQLGLIDTKADALGLSRAAWVRMVVAQALAQA